MKTFLIVVHLLISITITALIFLQPSGDADGRNSIFSTNTFQKRGWEKVLYYFTLTTLGIFLVSSLIQTII